MTRRSIITWKNAEVTVEQDGDSIIVLLFASNICVGRAVVELPIGPVPPKECKPIGPNTICITKGCPHWDREKGCTFYAMIRSLRNAE